MAEAPALGPQTVDFSVLVRKAAEASVSGLKELCETSPELSDTEKKIGLLKYIVKTRQRLLRLVALTKWCRQVNYSTASVNTSFDVYLPIREFSYSWASAWAYVCEALSPCHIFLLVCTSKTC